MSARSMQEEIPLEIELSKIFTEMKSREDRRLGPSSVKLLKVVLHLQSGNMNDVSLQVVLGHLSVLKIMLEYEPDRYTKAMTLICFVYFELCRFGYSDNVIAESVLGLLTEIVKRSSSRSIHSAVVLLFCELARNHDIWTKQQKPFYSMFNCIHTLLATNRRISKRTGMRLMLNICSDSCNKKRLQHSSENSFVFDVLPQLFRLLLDQSCYSSQIEAAECLILLYLSNNDALDDGPAAIILDYVTSILSMCCTSEGRNILFSPRWILRDGGKSELNDVDPHVRNVTKVCIFIISRLFECTESIPNPLFGLSLLMNLLKSIKSCLVASGKYQMMRDKYSKESCENTVALERIDDTGGIDVHMDETQPITVSRNTNKKKTKSSLNHTNDIMKIHSECIEHLDVLNEEQSLLKGLGRIAQHIYDNDENFAWVIEMIVNDHHIHVQYLDNNIALCTIEAFKRIDVMKTFLGILEASPCSTKSQSQSKSKKQRASKVGSAVGSAVVHTLDASFQKSLNISSRSDAIKKMLLFAIKIENSIISYKRIEYRQPKGVAESKIKWDPVYCTYTGMDKQEQELGIPRYTSSIDNDNNKDDNNDVEVNKLGNKNVASNIDEVLKPGTQYKLLIDMYEKRGLINMIDRPNDEIGNILVGNIGNDRIFNDNDDFDDNRHDGTPATNEEMTRTLLRLGRKLTHDATNNEVCEDGVPKANPETTKTKSIRRSTIRKSLYDVSPSKKRDSIIENETITKTETEIPKINDEVLFETEKVQYQNDISMETSYLYNVDLLSQRTNLDDLRIKSSIIDSSLGIENIQQDIQHKNKMKFGVSTRLVAKPPNSLRRSSAANYRCASAGSSPRSSSVKYNLQTLQALADGDNITYLTQPQKNETYETNVVIQNDSLLKSQQKLDVIKNTVSEDFTSDSHMHSHTHMQPQMFSPIASKSKTDKKLGKIKIVRT